MKFTEQDRFLVAHAEDITEWSEALADTVRRVVTFLHSRVLEHAQDTYDADTIHVAENQATRYPGVQLAMAGWPRMPDGSEPLVSVSWEVDRYAFTPWGTQPFVGLRVRPGAGEQAVAAIGDLRLPGHTRSMSWWKTWAYIPAVDGWAEDLDGYADAQIEALDAAWATLQPALVDALGT